MNQENAEMSRVRNGTNRESSRIAKNQRQHEFVEEFKDFEEKLIFFQEGNEFNKRDNSRYPSMNSEPLFRKPILNEQ
jgi:hypothetical protein